MNKKIQALSLLFNVAFSAYYILFGIISHSWWLFTIGIYYLLLSITRFWVLKIKGNRTIYFSGIMLMLLSLPIAVTVVLAVANDKGTIFNKIIMIAIAVYAFTKITVATVNLIKSRKNSTIKLVILKNISFADACVSIFTLQRAMLATFDGMTKFETRLANALTGSAVCIIVFILGVNLIRCKNKAR